MRLMLFSEDWSSLKHADLDTYVDNVTSTTIKATKHCTPSKLVNIRQQDCPWFNSIIKRKIRQRKRAYRKAKTSMSITHCSKFRHLRNDVVSLIRKAKLSYFDSLSNKLKKSTLASRDWWKTLRGFINPQHTKSIPPLFDETTQELEMDDKLKADILNNYFVASHVFMKMEKTYQVLLYIRITSLLYQESW